MFSMQASTTYSLHHMSQKIAFVGVGRMGANMARRLKDCGYMISAVYDAHRPSATSLAEELGCAAPETLAEVTRCRTAFMGIYDL